MSSDLSNDPIGSEWIHRLDRESRVDCETKVSFSTMVNNKTNPTHKSLSAVSWPNSVGSDDSTFVCNNSLQLCHQDVNTNNCDCWGQARTIVAVLSIFPARSGAFHSCFQNNQGIQDSSKFQSPSESNPTVAQSQFCEKQFGQSPRLEHQIAYMPLTTAPWQLNVGPVIRPGGVVVAGHGSCSENRGHDVQLIASNTSINASHCSNFS
jgi:hypothetical protein